MAINKSILGQDGFERTYHKIPQWSIIDNGDGTVQMQIVTCNWKDEESRKNNAQCLKLQHSIINLSADVMKIAYEMLKKHFPEYDDGNDIMDDDWKEKSDKEIILVSQTQDGKLIEKHKEEKTDGIESKSDK